jgi:hypothetical protein
MHQHDSSINDTKEDKQQYINKDKYQLLLQCQKSVYQATDSSPSIRKIINELITEDNLQKVKSTFIQVWDK